MMVTKHYLDVYKRTHANMVRNIIEMDSKHISIQSKERITKDIVIHLTIPFLCVFNNAIQKKLFKEFFN